MNNHQQPQFGSGGPMAQPESYGNPNAMMGSNQQPRMGTLPPMIGPPNSGPLGPMQDVMSLQELQRHATAVVAFGNVYPLIAGTNLHMSIAAGEKAVKEVLLREFC